MEGGLGERRIVARRGSRAACARPGGRGANRCHSLRLLARSGRASVSRPLLVEPGTDAKRRRLARALMSECLLTTREVANMLGLSNESVLRRWRAGELPGFRLSTKVLRFRESEVIAWLESCRGDL